MFARMKKQRTTFRWSSHQDIPPFNETKIALPNGIFVDASCNATVTINCLLELYNAVGFNASGSNENQIGITGYLEQFANIADLQLFYADQRPDALNSSFKFFPVAGSCHFSCDHVSSAHIAFRRTELAKRFRGWGRGQLGHSVRIRSYFPDTLDLFLDCRKSPVHPRHRYSYKYKRTILDC